jgi:phosphatidylglycerol:prolipoprotein diacylglycerol transferase
MIPYFHAGPLVLVPGTIELHLFGLLVGIGVLSGSWLAQKRAEAKGLHPRVISDLALWIVLCAFFFAHQVSLFLYFPERVFGPDGSWLEVFYIWDGISSYGGFLGALIAFLTFFSFKRIRIIPGVLDLVGGKGRPVLPYLDAIAMGFSVGWLFGRLGCFTAHDHIGKATTSPLAVNFPDGFRDGVPAIAEIGAAGFTPRFDLGFLEVLYCIPIIALFYLWARHKDDLRPGWFAVAMIIPYAPYRFWLDTLRATDISGADKRYCAELLAPGLTPGQIGSVVLLFVGLWLWWLGGKAKADPAYAERMERERTDAAAATAAGG